MSEQKTAAKAAEPKEQVVTIKTVYGDMVDVTNNARYTQEPAKVIMNWWITIQVEAGKIVIVE